MTIEHITLGVPPRKNLNNVHWERLHPLADIDMLGFIPSFLDLDEPGDAVEQLDRNYQHGGGFRPTVVNFKVDLDLNGPSELVYPGSPEDGEEDEIYPALYRAKFRDEWVYVFASAWVLVHKKDGTNVIARMD